MALPGGQNTNSVLSLFYVLGIWNKPDGQLLVCHVIIWIFIRVTV